MELTDGGEGLLDGSCTVELELRDGTTVRNTLEMPPGSPARPPTQPEMAAKVRDCAGTLADELLDLTWADAPRVHRRLPAAPSAMVG